MDTNNYNIYTVGFLAYLVDGCDEKDMKLNSFKMNGYKIFNFIFLNLNEYKRMFINECFKDDRSFLRKAILYFV